MSTPTERANEMARLVITAAQQDNACVVTSSLVDTVMKKHASTEAGQANAVSVRRLVRTRAAAAGVRVILTEEERYWAIREQLHHMNGDQVHALRDSIADGGESDPRGHDKVLVDAISVRLSNRVSPDRLNGVEPVSVRLWEEPEADAVGAMPEFTHGAVVEALEILRAAGVRVATVPARKMLYREWHSPQGPQGAFIWPGAGRTLEVSWFIDGAVEERGLRARETRTVRAARTPGLDDVSAAFRGAGWRVWRLESSNTATRRALRTDVTPPTEEQLAPDERAYAMRTVNGGVPERIDLEAARREVRWAMSETGRQGVRDLSGVGDEVTISYTDVRGVVELRPATAEEAAMVVKPEAERYAPGDRVIVRGVYYRPETRTHHVLPEYEGVVVNWHAGHYNVRAVKPDEYGAGGVRQCRARELRPAGGPAPEPAPVVSEEEADALVAEFGIGEGDLDEAANEDGADEYNGGAHPELSDDAAYEEVHDAADARASSVNNQGAAGQVQFLAEFCGTTEGLRSLLGDLLSPPAADAAPTVS